MTRAYDALLAPDAQELHSICARLGFRSVTDAALAVQQAAMDEAALRGWTLDSTGSGSRDPATVLFGDRSEDETLADHARRDDPLTLRWLLGAMPGIDCPATLLPNALLRADQPIRIYRSAERDIIPGSYVTESRYYAEFHAGANLRDPHSLYSMTARPSELISLGDPHEFIYAPTMEAWKAVIAERTAGIPAALRASLLNVVVPEPDPMALMRAHDRAQRTGEDRGAPTR